MLRIEKTCNFKGFLDGEDGNDSECSSSCQSRWTIYLGQSQKSFDTLLPLQTEASVQGEKGEEEEEDDEEEEEDLSMLSDASSGPPNAPENADNCCSTGNFLPVAAVNKRGSKRRRVEEEEKEGQSSILDDTASSTLLSISKASNNRSYSSKRLLMEEDMEHSCGFSATHFGESNIQQQCLDYLHTSSALNPAPVCRHEAEKKLL
ncbi:hypothetical protein HPP92_024592 [Vanilla planifolia]|uniref:Uncharacterized protein n=1 Tax=Vanilla planifolia TaxID=51239 RepID=A0A835UBG8_VANPL|nr:hypothetical protein HPP92_024592 [Vanilla planifolia]